MKINEKDLVFWISIEQYLQGMDRGKYTLIYPNGKINYYSGESVYVGREFHSSYDCDDLSADFFRRFSDIGVKYVIVEIDPYEKVVWVEKKHE